jgi:membrane-associated phospholipid phosphatase
MQPRLHLPAPAFAALAHSVLAFAFLAQAYAAGSPVVRLDAWVANALHANVVPSATTALSAVTTLGSTLVLALVVAAAAAFLLRRSRIRDAALVLVAFVGAQVVTWALKAIFERPRPSFADPVATAGWFSFPSGHALSSIAVYGALAYLLSRSLHSRGARTAVTVGTVLLVATIGFSRLYLGVHYLTDVLAGYSAGLALLLLAIAFVRGYGVTGTRRSSSLRT